MTSEQAYVFIDGLEDSPVICGVVTLDPARRFGLKTVKARKLISQVKDLVSEWPGYFARLGVGEGNIERLHGVIPGID